MSRGISNNNPGNIIISTASWLGKITPSRDPKFETFDSMEHGIRALAKILLTYYRSYSLDTITGIIKRWAPAVENDVTAYIDDVCTQTGYTADQVLVLISDTVLAALVKAIIGHENGHNNPVTDAQIDRGVEMALST